MQKKLLKQILPGLVPLLVFILADELWGTRIGLIVAVVFGIFGLVFYWIKDKKLEKFILFDTGLIVALGLVSIILDNDIFFKLKPGLIGLLVCTILAISAFTPKNLMLGMSQRYLKGVEFSDEQYKQLRQNMKVMFWIFSVHTGLVFYSVWFLSNEAWAFISGPLFYILFGAYFGIEFLRNKLKATKFKNEEWLPIVNEKGEITGKAPRSVCHSNKEYLHPVVHLHVLNKRGDLFLQKRPNNKLIQPGKWDTAVGGHISFGESVELSLQREALEEIGIKDFNPVLISNYIWKSDVESEYIFCFCTIYDGDFVLSKDELDGGRYWTIDEIHKNLNKGLFTPNFESEFTTRLIPFINKKSR